MKEPRKSIFNWNHISDELSEEQIEELKSYYRTYHEKCWAYKQASKHLKKWKLLGNSLSIIFASGGFASSLATGGISLIAISTPKILKLNETYRMFDWNSFSSPVRNEGVTLEACAC